MPSEAQCAAKRPLLHSRTWRICIIRQAALEWIASCQSLHSLLSGIQVLKYSSYGFSQGCSPPIAADLCHFVRWRDRAE